MKNLMAISLVPLARKQLKTISKAVIPNFGRVRITSEKVTLQKTLFGRKHQIPLIDFLMETLPKEINKWAESKDIESPLPYFGNSVEFLLHLNAVGEKNIILYLWKCYMHIMSFEYLEAESMRQVKTQYIVNTRVITNVIANKVVKDLKRMCNNVKRTIKLDVSKHYPFDVVYRSPDIRGSPKLRTYLTNVGWERGNLLQG